ncbi:cas scaffolding protein family member 4 isoform X1 [Tachysurus fulvidraco]|uniref:cas scaffolding protein family member 4 isoform X1 n=1 Tax=Tachysurus fulvidraco TaxID=1234273 RepID=UPI001FEEE691|nr:cas scaffolding protein family member 4 isoform X1 [Tachysurus fulvidraco]
METILAKALYDNTAESPDELAFYKDDVVVVIEKTVEGSVGWWKCSLNGQEGLAPANRLRLLSPSESIYQTPRPAEASLTYEAMEKGNKMVHGVFTPSTDMYAVPRLWRKGSLYTPLSPRPTLRQTLTIIQKRSEVIDNSKSIASEIYAVPPTPSKDPNYDIPVSSKSEPHLKLVSNFNTLPNPRKCEQIYDVPVALEMPISVHGFYGTMPSKGAHSGKEVYDTPTSCVRLAAVNAGCIYDIPKCREKTQQRTDSNLKEEGCIYDVPPSLNKREPILNVLTLPNQIVTNPGNSENASKPIEDRCKPGPMHDLPRRQSSWGRQIMVSRELQERRAKTTENEVKNDIGVSVSENQRDSTVSNSSNTSSSSRSSCDSMFGSTSPEPLREVTLSPEEAAQRLLQLQETVCQAVPQLMDFVSSHWRSREHLGQHLQQIRAASEDVANSVTSFLNFVLDIRGNALRLTDSNLQARLQKQLSIVENSGLIVQNSVDALCGLGWPLDVLAQDPGQPQISDQLERFVMVARTLPEDMKRLVSIINANSKLLFRNSSKEPEMPKNTSLPHVIKSIGKNEPPLDKEWDDDYVHLQTKTEFEKLQQTEEKNDIKLDMNQHNEKKQVSKPKPTSFDRTSQHKPLISDHCRLYFGATRKAIAVFVSSLEEQQPPEKFISHSKLVIMVGQRLIDTLYCEAQGREDSQELLHKSNHLCALLKHLAVATKKAALHFPDKVAIKEAQDFAKELAQRAHQFRMFMEN